ncbi:Choline trimethylamine-lyase activating enzyme [bioreactor metagenome]|uniref:Pyruvate formate lyase activating enzyme n=2 Tax=root TaxID=1 RepID=A0A562J5U6_9FIRM|nr:trans-4-hydroxy-L-proline dehydratase activase [Sedimentibacter saalensis]MEA5094722.1 trans-4-hydroxy-L-proline dehydratase activase [Sedimentibacter saalensis]TWH78473.1 pyruvate formate lyase activating enzyme [Sedimentibacter saalensis]
MNTANIFNIQKFSVHDGPGIRTTVFFKGCPLKCLWCHNPESQNINTQILYDRDKCVLCGTCEKICHKKAIKIENNKLTTDESCDCCGQCVIYCIQGARQIAGKVYTVDDVMKEVLKDRVFYEKSSGGVTLSGGEPLIHIDFVEELLKKLKDNNIHTAVDTCGAVSFENLKRAAKYTDVFLYDIKLMDDEKHVEFIGMSNKLILENIIKLSEIHNNINLRMPIIEGVNGDEEHIIKTIEFIEGLNISKVNLLPYHDIAKHKYKKLGKVYEDDRMSKPSDEKMQKFKEMFENKGYKAKIGG